MNRSVVITGIVLLSASLLKAEDVKLTISGADAMVPLLTKCAEAYKAVAPGVAIEVTGGGAGKGIKDALAGKISIGMSSRELDTDEAQRGAAVPVARDAVFATVNEANPVAKELAVKGFPKKTLKALWLGGKALTWGEAVGGDNKDAIALCTREDACGAAEVWGKYLGATQAELKGTPVKGDNGLADAVRKDPKALGYNNLQAAYDLATGTPAKGLIVVSIDANDNGKVDPQEDISTKEKAFAAIADGIYPAPPARTLFLVTKGKFAGPAKDFVAWLLKDGQAAAKAAGYIPLDAKGAEAAFKAME